MWLVLQTPPQRPFARRLGGLGLSVGAHVALALFVLAIPPHVQSTAPTEVPAPTITVVDQREVPEADAQSESAIEPAAAEDEPSLELRGLKFDTNLIRARAHALFPFLTENLVFLNRLEEQSQSRRRGLANPYGAEQRIPTRPPLTMSDRQIQQVVDSAWSRQQRWKGFRGIEALMQRHDASEGRVADVLHAYVDQNLLQPYLAGRGLDPRFWVTLGLAADHRDFIELATRYIRNDSSTRTATELLFLLDELVQGSCDALLILIRTVPERDLRYTAAKDRSALRLAVDIRRHYDKWLRERGLTTPDAIRLKYDERRLRLLNSVLDSTPDGYRAGDAHFLIGEILFRQGKVVDAVRHWRAIRKDPTDNYSLAYTELLSEIASVPSYSVTAKALAVLQGEHQRWLDRSWARLRQFGYTFDTF